MKSRLRESNRNLQSTYGSPEKLLEDPKLTREEKREALENWKAEAIHKEESTAEGFAGGKPSPLDDILSALRKLENEG